LCRKVHFALAALFQISIKELDRPPHCRAEVVRDIVVVALVFVEFHELTGVEHLKEQVFRK
jgi:hypothetical protein